MRGYCQPDSMTAGDPNQLPALDVEAIAAGLLIGPAARAISQQ